MNDKTDQLSGEMRKLWIALAAETKDRKAADDEINKKLNSLGLLLSDHSGAVSTLIKLLSRMESQYASKMLVLTQAISDFNGFLKLPPQSNRFLAVWDAGWAMVALAVPALRLSPALAKIEKTAAIEMIAAKAFMKIPSLTARIASYTVKYHNISDVISKSNTTRDRVLKGLETIEKDDFLSDRSRAPIKELMDESENAHKVFDAVIDAVEMEYKARLHSLFLNVSYVAKESLEEKVVRMMGNLPFLTKAQLARIGKVYLWNILASWAKQNVAVVTTMYASGDGAAIEGLNDTQKEQIMSWFGPGTDIWSTGLIPPITSVWLAVRYWGVPNKRAGSPGLIFGFG